MTNPQGMYYKKGRSEEQWKRSSEYVQSKLKTQKTQTLNDLKFEYFIQENFDSDLKFILELEHNQHNP